MEDVRPAITAMQKLEALAALERTPARSKDIAKELGVSEILLYRWKTQFEDGGELTDEAPTPTAIHTKPQAAPALPPPPADLPARTVRTYTEEQKRAAVESFLAGGISLSECGSKHDVNPKTLEYWVQVARSKLPPSREKGYRSVAKREEVQREYREDLTASIPKLAKKHRISKSTVWEWCKDIRKSSNQKVLAHAASVKEEAIAAYLQGDESETAIAKRLEIGRTTLSGWIKVATGLAEPPKPVGREPLTELRDRVVAEFREGLLGTSELAVKHNVHPKTVATWIRRALLSTGSTGYGNHSKYTPEFRYKVGKAVLDGMSSAAAARQFGMDQGGRSALDWAQAIRERRLRAPEENTDEMPAHRKYPDEKRAAVLADIDAGMAEKDAALKHDVPKGTIQGWVKLAAREKKDVPMARPGSRLFDKAFKYEIAKAVLEGVRTRASVQDEYSVASGQVSQWVKAYREGKLKAPRKKPGRKPQSNGHEIVDVHAAQPTQLALPVQMVRVTTLQEELIRKDAKIAELERKLRKAMSMVFDDD